MLRSRDDCTVGLQVVLSLSCFALASWLFFDQHLGESMRIKGFPVDRWLIAIAAVAPIYCVSRVLSSLLLMLSEFIFEHHQQVHYVILGLWWPLTFASSRILASAELLLCLWCGLDYSHGQRFLDAYNLDKQCGHSSDVSSV